MMAQIIKFPDTPLYSLRRQLRRSHNVRMLQRWGADFVKQAGRLPDEDRLTLALEFRSRRREAGMPVEALPC